MASHMDLLAASRVIDKNIDPEAGHVLIGEGDYTSFKNKAEIMHRARNTPDLVASAAGMLGDSRTNNGAVDLADVEWHDMNAAPNENNRRVHRRMVADGRKDPRVRKPGQPPYSNTDDVAQPVEGSNRDEGGGANVGALGSIPKADEVLAELVPPKPVTVIDWKKNV